MNAEIRSNIRLRWLESLYELSHLNFQRELWIEAKYPEIIGNCDEAICKYFDDLNLSEGYLNPSNVGIYEQSEQQAVSTFHQELSNYLDKPEKRTLTDTEVLKDSEWQQLSALGLIAWDEIKQLLTKPEELALADELERKYGK